MQEQQRRTMQAIQLDDSKPPSVQAEIETAFSELLARHPDAVLVMAKCGGDLAIRAAGAPFDVIRLYGETMPAIESMLRDMVKIAAGQHNG